MVEQEDVLLETLPQLHFKLLHKNNGTKFFKTTCVILLHIQDPVTTAFTIAKSVNGVLHITGT